MRSPTPRESRSSGCAASRARSSPSVSTGPRRPSGPRSAARGTSVPARGSATWSPSGSPSWAPARTTPGGTPGSGPTATGRSSSRSWPAAGSQVAEWVFDPRRRHIAPDDDHAARLCLPADDLAPLSFSAPGPATATVTPIASRLGGQAAHHPEPRSPAAPPLSAAARGAVPPAPPGPVTREPDGERPPEPGRPRPTGIPSRPASARSGRPRVAGPGARRFRPGTRSCWGTPASLTDTRLTGDAVGPGLARPANVGSPTGADWATDKGGCAWAGVSA